MPTPRAFEWALGLASVETTFGTAQADGSMTDWVTPTEADFAAVDTSFRTDESEINGFVGVTEHQVESKQGKLARKFNASVEILGWALAVLFGRVTVTGTTPNYVHTIKCRNVCTLVPPSFSFVEGLICAGATGTYWLYKGCVVNQISIEVNGKGAVAVTLDVWTDGSETAKTSFSFPASKTSVNKIIGSMFTLSVGGTDISSLIRTCKITISAGITVPPSISGGVYVAEYQYGGTSPKIDIDFTMKGDKSHAVYADYQNNTQVAVVAALTYSSTRLISLTCSQCILTATVKPSGNETQLDVKVMPEFNSTDSGQGVFTAKTSTASYLNAA